MFRPLLGHLDLLASDAAKTEIEKRRPRSRGKKKGTTRRFGAAPTLTWTQNRVNDAVVYFDLLTGSNFDSRKLKATLTLDQAKTIKLRRLHVPERGIERDSAIVSTA